MRLTRLQALAIADAHWRFRAADLNRWIDEAENDAARWRRIAGAKADEKLWMEIVEWLEDQRAPRSMEECLEAARKVAVTAAEAISPGCGGNPGHPEAERHAGLIALWGFLVTDFAVSGLPLDRCHSLSGPPASPNSDRKQAA